jgi:hypothetical protein
MDAVQRVREPRLRRNLSRCPRQVLGEALTIRRARVQHDWIGTTPSKSMVKPA